MRRSLAKRCELTSSRTVSTRTRLLIRQASSSSDGPDVDQSKPRPRSNNSSRPAQFDAALVHQALGSVPRPSPSDRPATAPARRAEIDTSGPKPVFRSAAYIAATQQRAQRMSRDEASTSERPSRFGRAETYRRPSDPSRNEYPPPRPSSPSYNAYPRSAPPESRQIGRDPRAAFGDQRGGTRGRGARGRGRGRGDAPSGRVQRVRRPVDVSPPLGPPPEYAIEPKTIYSEESLRSLVGELRSARLGPPQRATTALPALQNATAVAVKNTEKKEVAVARAFPQVYDTAIISLVQNPSIDRPKAQEILGHIDKALEPARPHPQSQ
ncbi:uncharacterized protein L969DRAFT_103962 [Mixia osmundae IAM 14324]|uniref:Uncharacterized protein n=1 Tax=Mixia osmundae (strain CBS 9802 / IAM 14324 / JCM 22182 / KY 12970) TaxID=764103 RepID=G7E723_MIXOS|nr:uncharacterized protein L969DRAFT_103962 [Mixia osmundae IAM 14324]KEI38985.1 hypothetical protein L969DRAFT_103962 [Mixia osmundae IAM 14324]GAA98633.1 hypothetical protein E5Q_05320 [Mixia osmundae IAM 14324]